MRLPEFVSRPAHLARAIAWFIPASWGYLGCSTGTGRWRARRVYLTGLAPAMARFTRSTWNDRVERVAS